MLINYKAPYFRHALKPFLFASLDVDACTHEDNVPIEISNISSDVDARIHQENVPIEISNISSDVDARIH